MSSEFANNKGADQPAHPRRLISANVIHLLESFLSKLATSDISIFKLGAWFESCFVGNPEDIFVASTSRKSKMFILAKRTYIFVCNSIYLHT